MRVPKFVAAALVATCLLPAAAPASAENIVVTHWGSIMDGLPWAVALDQGYFKKEGVDVTGVVSSNGGGTTVRDLLASPIQYAEVAPSAAISAVQSGIPLKIVNFAVDTVSDFIVAVKPGSSINSIKDLVGKKWALTSPKSNTDIISQMMLKKDGIPLNKVQRPAIGSIMANLQALDSGSVQAIFMLEPVSTQYADKLRVIARPAEVLPQIVQTVGVATTSYIKEHPDKIRAIIEARRMGVDFARKHPDEAARILVKYYQGLDPKVAQQVVRKLVKVEYFSPGTINLKALENTVSGMKLVGLLKGDVDLKAMVDGSLLPADLQKKAD